LTFAIGHKCFVYVDIITAWRKVTWWC